VRVLYAASRNLQTQHTCALLAHREFRLTFGTNAQDVTDLATNFTFDAIILCSPLNGQPVIDLLHDLRRRGIKTPALVLAVGQVHNKLAVSAFGAGADDVVATPIQIEELTARIIAIVRRANGHSSTLIQTDRLTVDLTNRHACVSGAPLRLTGKEYDVLEALALRKGRMMTREALLDTLYSGEDGPGLKIIDVFVCKLRRKLIAALGGEDLITTVWGRGYMLTDTARALAHCQTSY